MAIEKGSTSTTRVASLLIPVERSRSLVTFAAGLVPNAPSDFDPRRAPLFVAKGEQQYTSPPFDAHVRIAHDTLEPAQFFAAGPSHDFGDALQRVQRPRG